jgi:cytochrome P450
LNTVPLKTAVGPRGLDLLKLVYHYYRDPLATLGDAAQKYGDITLFQVGPYTFHQITHPRHIQHVLQNNNRNYDIDDSYIEVEAVAGRGLATNRGDPWLWARRLMQPLFSRGQVSVFAPLMTCKTADLIERWSPAAREGQVTNLYPDLLALNHHILGKLLFNADFTGENGSILEALRITRDYTNRRINALVTVPNRVPTQRNRQFWAAVETLDHFVYGLIAAARQKPAGESDLLSMMVNLRDEKGVGMTDVQLHDELMTLFFVGYEDPANALAWTLALLMTHPEMMERVRTEIDSLLAGRAPTYFDLSNLTYTSAVIDEALRLYPPTWTILRDVVEDDVIEGYKLPKGSSILVNVYLTHRLTEFWENPDVFNPERFLPEQATSRPRYAYLPFGGGPRQCIGAALALMQIRLMLVLILQHYHLTPLDARMPRPGTNHSLRPAEDMAVYLRPV